MNEETVGQRIQVTKPYSEYQMAHLGFKSRRTGSIGHALIYCNILLIK